MDCCVASWVALSEPMASSSSTALPDTDVFNTPVVMVGELIIGEVRVLLVRVSVVARPTKVSVAAGKVKVTAAFGSAATRV